MIVRVKYHTEALAEPEARSTHAMEKQAGRERPPRADTLTPREMATGLTTMLAPVTAMSFALALWRLGADMGWTGGFAIRNGILSHWQVWMMLAVALQWLSIKMKRRFRNDDDQQAAR
jgi:hypothetical protein